MSVATNQKANKEQEISLHSRFSPSFLHLAVSGVFLVSHTSSQESSVSHSSLPKTWQYYSDRVSKQTSLAVFSLSRWVDPDAIRNQFMVGRTTPFSCSASCPLEFSTTTTQNPYLISGTNTAYDRRIDIYTCQQTGPHVFSWSVGVAAGIGSDSSSAVRIVRQNRTLYFVPPKVTCD